MDRRLAGIIKRGGKRSDCCNVSLNDIQPTHLYNRRSKENDSNNQ